MKICLLQKMPCIRSWKLASVLKELGHQVYLGQIFNTLENMYTLPMDVFEEVFYVTSLAGLSEIIPYFDIMHCANEDDVLCNLSLAYRKGTSVPVIHDCHDFVGGREQVSIHYLANSVVANTMSDLAIYVSEVQRDLVARRVGKLTDNIIIMNSPLKKYIPEKLMKKKEGDKVKVVYAGGVSEDPKSHRFFIPVFKELVQKGFEVYVYAPAVSPEYKKLEGFREYHNMGHCVYSKLMYEMSQYDLGILPFTKNSINADHVDMGLPNKLFEYFSAGLPIICKSGLLQQEMFLKEHGGAFIYDTIDDVKENIDEILKIKVNRHQFNFDDEVKTKLIPYYEKLGVKNEYRKVKAEKLLEKTNEILECEVYGEKGDDTAFYGRGRKKDLIFESWIKEEGKKEDA